jgi:hypothetical protein
MAQDTLKELFRMMDQDNPDATYVYYVLLELKDRLGISRIIDIGRVLREGDDEDFDADFWNSVEENAWIKFSDYEPFLARKVDSEHAARLLGDVIDYLMNKAR